jgi:plasmid stabilization system protein ParE
MKASFSVGAIDDINAAVDWYIEQGAIDAAAAMLDDIDASLQLLRRHPHLGSPGANNTRSMRLHVFPHSLVYRVMGDVIRVIAVAAHRRRPGYWHKRR